MRASCGQAVVFGATLPLVPSKQVEITALNQHYSHHQTCLADKRHSLHLLQNHGKTEQQMAKWWPQIKLLIYITAFVEV